MATSPRSDAYDANTNRSSHTIAGIVTPLTYQPDSNRLAQIGTQSQSLDAAGTVTYRYDGQGRRIEKTGPASLVPNGAVRFMYDEANHLIGEYQADGSPTREYVWLGDLPVAVIDTNTDGTTTAYAIETDHLGTPRLLTDATQSPSWRWTSPPFGEVLPDENPAGLYPVTFNLRFPGQYYDKESGLSYNWHRVYDAETGRYVQSDPIGLDGGWNTYGYVNGNPLSYIDPMGLNLANPADTLGLGGGLSPGGGGRSASGGGGAEGLIILGGVAVNAVINAVKEWCSDDDDSVHCSMASDYQMAAAGITDAHEFKRDFVGGRVSRYDICACEDGSIKLAARGQCGTSGPKIGTGYSWK